MQILSTRQRPTQTRRTFPALAALAVAALAAGCSDFQDPTTVIDLRVLGLAADPPEIYVNPSALPTDPVTSNISALVVDPKGGGRPISYNVLACPRDIDTVTAATGKNGVICQPNQPGETPTSLEVVPDGTTTPPTDTGPVHTIGFQFQVPPALLSAAFSGDSPAAGQGFQLPIVIQMAISAGSESVTTTKRVIFSQPIMGHEDQPPNANPTVTSIQTYADRDASKLPIDPVTHTVAAGMVDSSTPLTVKLGQTIWIEPQGAVAESYYTPALTRDNPPQMETKLVDAETLRFSFSTTAGTFAPAATSNQQLQVIFDQLGLESQYTAPKTMPDDGADQKFWIVTRDERGGASWIQGTITLVP
jgi:hypothetical protein